MKRLKMRCLSIFLSLFVLVNSIFVPALNVQAAELTYTLSVLEALLSLFGLEIGLGNQSEFFTNSEFTDFVNAVANGETVTLSPYGEVNFSDGESILAFMTWASALTYSAADGNVLNAARILDSTSYKTSGTSATSAMEQKISNYVGDYNGSSEALAEDVQSTFRVITGGSGSGSDDDDDDDDDDDEDVVMTPNRWDMFTAVMSTFLFGASEAFNGFVDKFSTPEETEYQDYENAFDDNAGFVPGASLKQYSYVSDPSYSYYENYRVIVDVGIMNNTFVQMIASESYPLCFVVDPYMTLYKFDDSLSKMNFVFFSHDLEDEKFYHSSQAYFNQNLYVDVGYVSYIPVFSSTATAKAYFNDGDTSGILNLVDVEAYPNFRKTAPTAISTLSNTINKWMDTNPAIDNFPAAVSNVLDTSDTVAGTSDAVPAVNEAIAETAGVDTDTDSSTGTDTNYMGILGKILSVLQSILNSILGKIASLLQSILDAIISIKTFLVELLEAAFVPDLDYWEAELDARVDALEDRISILTLPLTIIVLLMDVVTNSDGIGDFILTIPVIEYKGATIFEGYSFNVSEFVRQDMWVTFYNMYILITDIIVVCYIANYGRKKFAAIIMGASK